ncbi:type IV secretory system conjugative DNA transfer family protein [Mobilitalea sibirica]|uniref:Type IV secretory system conjugative DNA transfer family protein n=1 Tax=Mobilitalea sibirica TaxID=1462919 RepID=A0A8J7L0J5_9FIRM|nr:type IV secretory system conjugative DNA transfer family protein [Mobilitalea sibirica]MBH1942543.1 type IV secretory system conjugative DNA transfer family protein [Mobilitalea sibirica]
MFFLNDSVAKLISKNVKGRIGIYIHNYIMAGIYFLIGIGLNKILMMLMGISKSEFKKYISMPTSEFKTLLKEPYFIVLIAMILIFFILLIGGEHRAKKYFNMAKASKNQNFGKARFSDISEILKTGLTGDGIIFGKINKKIISKPPTVEGHVLITGGTGTGKSRGVVIPTLLRWQGAALVMDIKGELSKKTSDRRKVFGKVYVFNPEGEGDCYDPIVQCKTIDQAQDLARTLIPIPEKGEPFWAQSAQAILSAFVYEGAYTNKTLPEIAETLCTTPITELVEHCRNSDIREVRILASITYDLPEKTLGGIMGELKSKLITIATDQNIHKATRKSDWSPETLEEGATVYLRVSEHLIEQYKGLLTVIISQVLKHLSKREERKEPPILIAIDETPRLSKIDGLTNALATLRSRNVHIMCVIQSMAQLDKIYGKDERKVIADNCRFKFILSATDPETQKYFSDLAGQKTVMAKGESFSTSAWGSSKSEQGTPLIRPEEWANLEQPILLAPRLQPVKLDLAFWDIEKF